MKKHLSSFKPKSIVLCLFLIFGFFLVNTTYGQNHQERYNALDVLAYTFEIRLNDSTDEMRGNALLQIAFKEKTDTFVLDLSNINDEGRGMVIDKVYEDDQPIHFKHQNDQIELAPRAIVKDEIRNYRIVYHGIPKDGLIISTNKFGDRVFFADCWPNRAHQWLPTVDHPSDKATVEFIVEAPSHYQVVANGMNGEETNDGENTITHWKTKVPISTKLMVIGVARFAKQYLPDSTNTHVSSWVYPQNRNEGFIDYQIALKPLAFYSSHIAPFPFSKLANVQSTTRYGGMENASCIFYSENSVTGNQDQENLFAHEIAHQWFGDAVSELNWHHIWLSEGFATYLTGLYIENEHGKEEFRKWMQNQRVKVLIYSKYKLTPVIDTSLSVSVDLLNPNSYQKGAWFLHMLRKELGDELFWKSIQTFYHEFEYRNALTEDFQSVVEKLSGKNMDAFFKQWLYKSGHPQLAHEWDYNGKEIRFKLIQKQKNTIFHFPLELKIIYEDGSSSIKTIRVTKSEELFLIASKKKPKTIIPDPDTWLLFEDRSFSVSK